MEKNSSVDFAKEQFQILVKKVGGDQKIASKIFEVTGPTWCVTVPEISRKLVEKFRSNVLALLVLEGIITSWEKFENNGVVEMGLKELIDDDRLKQRPVVVQIKVIKGCKVFLQSRISH